MTKSAALEQKAFAKSALIQAAGVSKVGNFIEVSEEGEGVATFLFENNHKGYLGWRWSVTVFQLSKNDPATISEILLMPGPESLVAPDWVPWSERLADYKALQLELEKQAELESEESSEEDASEDAAEQSVEEDSAEVVPEDSENDVEVVTDESARTELAVSNLEVGEDPENDSENTGRKPPRFLLRRKGFKIKKARGKGKDPQHDAS